MGDNQALVVSTRDSWVVLQEEAKMALHSGLLPEHIKSVEVAITIAMVGRELGISPWRALTGIQVIKGTPTLKAELMAQLIYREHGSNALDIVETTAEKCTISYQRKGAAQRRTFTYTMEMARQAALQGNQNYSKHPANMLRARCISNIARMAFPDAIAGCYTEDEAGEFRPEPTRVEEDPPPHLNRETGEITHLPPRRVTVHEPPPTATPASQAQHDRIIELAGELFGTSGVAVTLHQDYTEDTATAEIAALEERVADASMSAASVVLATEEQRGKVAACVAAFAKFGRPIEPPPASFTSAEIEQWLAVKRAVMSELKATANKDRSPSYAAAG